MPIQAQSGSPPKVCALGFGGAGLGGNTVWQRQQTSLSSGFHVPQFVQSISLSSLIG